MRPDKKILGVCAWLAEHYGLDVVGLRLAFVLGVFLSVGTAVLLYFILYLIMPKR